MGVAASCVLAALEPAPDADTPNEIAEDHARRRHVAALIAAEAALAVIALAKSSAPK